MFKRIKKIFSTPSPDDGLKASAAQVSENHAGESAALRANGNALLADGQFDAAAECYRQVIAADPAKIEGYINLGYALTQLKQTDTAKQILAQAIRLDPASIDALYMLATIARDDGMPDDATEYLERILVAAPRFQNAYGELAQLLVAQGSIDRAQAVLQKGIEQFPDLADFHFHLAKLQMSARSADDAIGSLMTAVALRPDSVDIHGVLAPLLMRQKRYAEALVSFRRITEIKPDAVDALVSQGKLLFAMGQHDDALRSFDCALARTPDHVDALIARSAILLGFQRNEEAVVNCEQVVRLMPASAEAHLNLGAALQSVQRYEEALISCEQALAISPDSVDALINRGTALAGLNRHEEALACHERALVINPDDADGRYNECLVNLTMGNFERGWALHEWRWKTAHFIPSKRNFPQPLWLGIESLQGKSILLHAEQGLGDAIQFCRYAELVAARGATVFLEVQAGLIPVMANLSGVERLLTQGEALPQFDFHCPLLSLPLAFHTELHTIPATPSYLHSAPQQVSKWESRLGDQKRLRIGIVWSGSTDHKNDRNRSIPLADLCHLFSEDADFICLQKEIRPSDRVVLDKHPELSHFENELRDFSDTAALIANVDLVISVDTSIAHLAGALGKPVWILVPFNPDWRWLLMREDSPWYPSARLFRQSRINDWRRVINRLSVEVSQLVGEKSNLARNSSPATDGLSG